MPAVQLEVGKQVSRDSSCWRLGERRAETSTYLTVCLGFSSVDFVQSKCVGSNGYRAAGSKRADPNSDTLHRIVRDGAVAARNGYRLGRSGCKELLLFWRLKVEDFLHDSMYLVAIVGGE